MSLLISFRGPRRRQILLGPKGGRSSVAEKSMSVVAPGELRIPRQARWIVTLELHEQKIKQSTQHMPNCQTTPVITNMTKTKHKYGKRIETNSKEANRCNINTITQIQSKYADFREMKTKHTEIVRIARFEKFGPTNRGKPGQTSFQ